MRIGIIGTGRIAKRFISECSFVPELDVSAVYNPHAGSAERFAVSVNINAQPLSDIRELWKTVDSVYIASPHETHFDYIMSALREGKHVLCEKPMTLNPRETIIAFDSAKEKKLVLREGLKTAYCPGYLEFLKVANSGIIGELCYVDACFTKLEDPGRRELTDPEYGGSFTELGSYVMLPAADLLGTEYKQTDFDSIRGENGLDLFTRLNLSFQKGMSTLLCGLGVKSEGRLMVSGTKGYMIAEAPWWKTRHFEIHFEDPDKTLFYDEPFEGDGLRYEIAEFMRRIGSGEEFPPESEMRRSVFFAEMMERSQKNRIA